MVGALVQDFLHADSDHADGPGDSSGEGRGAASAAPGGDGEWEPAYGSLEEWVIDYFTPMYARTMPSSSLRWCARWWDHPEGINRLEAL